jgi:hypothetical protein
MSKVKEKSPTIIPANEFKPELESEVQYHLSKVIPQIKNTIKYSRTVYPKFKDKREELDFQLEEIRRCIHGYNQMSGKMYFWYNYCCLRDPELGKIRPEYRTISRDWFQFIEDHQKQEDKTGIIAIKRRRVGASWMAAADVLHDSIFKPYFQVGMNSKSEKDSRDLFKNIKFIYQNLPDWLRPRTTASDRRDFLEFAWYEKDSAGNRTKKGNQSWIVSLPPTDSGHEGAAYSKLIIDEAGKIPNLLTIWAYAQDCLMKPPRRVGLPLIFGTVGDITKDGYGIKEMWEKNHIYKLDKFFFAGYNAMDGMIDEFGNDFEEHAIRYIIYERDRLKTARKELESFKQKYPLNEKDAFNQMSEGGIGNIILINEQITKLSYDPVEARTGWMRAKPDGGVDFVPNSEGKIIVYDLPDPNRVNGYVAGADPADSDEKKKKAGNDVSDLALAIVAKPIGLEPPKLVLEYVDRPEKLDGFFEQSAMALKWYNNTKVLIEDNRARMVNYFKTNYPNLLPLVPISILTAKGGFELKRSITMTEARKQQGIGLVEDNIDHYSKFIPSIKLLEQFKVFGDLHASDDLAMSYLLALIMLQADKKVSLVGEQPISHQYRLERTRDGRLLQNVPQQSTRPSRNIPKHPLFR